MNIKENEVLNQLNHSCAHVLAQAIKHIYPQAKFWVGPVINEGFYYDIDLGDVSLKIEDLEVIEKEMKKICKDGKRIVKEELSIKDALELFVDDIYKLELIAQFSDPNIPITCYKQGDFTDLCRGPHQPTVKDCRYFKLLKVSGAYWKGDAKNKMLQRVYGVCFFTIEDLNQHLYLLEEAKKRDHRKLGKELSLFSFSEYGPGFPFWLPNGMALKKRLEDFWYQEHEKEGYKFVQTPIMLDQELWKVSGHWENYQENMYISEIDDKTFVVKPMNCPGGILIYKEGLYSYRDLPLRMGELGIVHRHEASGALSGLFRVRNFTQDDAHLFMTIDQLQGEIVRLINFITRMYGVFGLTYSIELSTRPDKYIGELAVWEKAESDLAKACTMAGKDFKINPKDGAFYGPKLDFHINDSLGRVWQCGTIQLDINLPERFDLHYVDAAGERQRPIMLHRVIYGSMERFIGILIEHYGGNFPLWLSPMQIIIIPVLPSNHSTYSMSIKDQLVTLGYRVEIDERNEKLGYRMRAAQMRKIPVQLVLGEKEQLENTVNLRFHGNQETSILTFNELAILLNGKILQKT